MSVFRYGIKIYRHSKSLDSNRACSSLRDSTLALVQLGDKIKDVIVNH